MTSSIDLTGLAAVIAVLGGPLTVIFAQYNTRAAIRAAAAQAKKDADEHLEILKGQNAVLATVKDDVAETKQATNGALAAAHAISDQLSAEVQRVARGGTPTPYGEPSDEHPVTLTAGVPATVKPPPITPKKPSDEPPTP